LMRNLISRIVDSTPGLRTVDKAMNGVFALQKIPRCQPDIIVLDIEMPEMNGIEFLKERQRLGIDIPVVILSSVARSGAQVTMEALSLGAVDFITKPSGSVSSDIHTVAGELSRMLVAYGSQYQREKGRESTHYSYEAPERMFDAVEAVPHAQSRPLLKSVPKTEPAKPVRSPGPTEIVVIGISTGGPNALREVFAHIAADLGKPVVVVQHMPAGFTEEFAASLDRICPLEVKEAADGDVLKPGRVLIAPGDWHVTVEKRSLAGIVRVNQDPPENGHRPSADVLFRSVAREYGNRALAVIMTGMGKDGALELGSIYREGGVTLGQDEGSSVVYGMPKVAFEMGNVMEQVPLNRMAERISALARESR
jgi:two-component system, chemotaxis family, protein-glutamate methylesterase/glutaminase